MDYLIDFDAFRLNHGDAILVLALCVIVGLVSLNWLWKRVIFWQQEAEDMADSDRRSIDLLLEEKKKRMYFEEAWLAAKNEKLALRREISILKEKIQKKGEFRLLNGTWCTEEQYLAQFAKYEERLDNSHEEQVEELQEKLDAVDRNEDANKQIEEYLKK